MSRKLIAGMLFMAAAASFAAPGPGGAAAPVVAAEKAVAADDTSVKMYVGRLKAIEEVDLPARVSGVLEKQLINHGDSVKKGQLLFQIEDTTYRAKVASARAQVAQCESELRYSKSNLKRNTHLNAQKAVSESAFEEAVRLNATNEARLAAARAALMDAENDLGYTRIYAPFDGRIGKCTYSTGSYVTPSSEKLGTVVTVDPLNVDFSISERDYLSLFGSIASVKKNAVTHLFLADGSSYPGEGKIIFVDNKVDSDTGTVTIRAQFRNKAGNLIPGGLAKISLGCRNRSAAVSVPLSAVMIDGNGAYVYTLDAKNTVSRRNVVTGGVVKGAQIIKAGLKAGDMVVTDGTHKVRPGSTVNPIFRADKGSN